MSLVLCERGLRCIRNDGNEKKKIGKVGFVFLKWIKITFISFSAKEPLFTLKRFEKGTTSSKNGSKKGTIFYFFFTFL